MPRDDRLQVRRGTAAAWATANPVLLAGEPGLEIDSGVVKFGDGTTAWNALPFANEDAIADLILENGSSGRELAVAESVVVQGPITAVADLTGLSISFVVGARPVWVESELPSIASTDACAGQAQITDLANAVKRRVSGSWYAPGEYQALNVSERISTPGSYNRKMRLLTFAGSGGLANGFDASTVAYIRAIEA